MADRRISHVWEISGLVVAVWMSATLATAQDPVQTFVEPVQPSEHPLIAPPKPLATLRLHTAPTIAGRMPSDVKQPSQNVFPATPFVSNAGGWHCECPYGRYYLLCHDPLLMEDIPLERYGCEMHCCVQPVASAVKFYATIPTLPFKAAMNCCRPCSWCRDYMGQLRPGVHECGCGPLWCTNPNGCCGTGDGCCVNGEDCCVTADGCRIPKQGCATH